jgi:hypothetical protein
MLIFKMVIGKLFKFFPFIFSQIVDSNSNMQIGTSELCAAAGLIASCTVLVDCGVSLGNIATVIE